MLISTPYGTNARFKPGEEDYSARDCFARVCFSKPATVNCPWLVTERISAAIRLIALEISTFIR